MLDGWVRDRTSRGVKSYRAYICLFVYIATKTVNLELVSDLYAEAFIRPYDAL